MGAVQQVLSGLNTAPLVTYATLNPSDKGTNITLSGGNLVASSTGTGSFVRSTISKTTGKWYWEVILTSTTLYRRWCTGIVGAGDSNNSTPGSGATGYTYYVETGARYGPSSVYNTPAYGAATCAAGDIVGVALDLDAGTITFYKNNVSQGVCYSGLSGTFYAEIGSDNQSTDSNVATVNFGATTLTYSPPAGFNAGLYV
jgi:hypothetical protein